MRKLIRLAATLAVAAPLLALPSGAGARGSYWPRQSVVCDGVNVTTVSGVVGNVDVPVGATCDISDATINGNLSVEGTATVDGVTVNGNMSVGDSLDVGDGSATVTDTYVSKNFVAYPSSSVDFSGGGDTVNWSAECSGATVASGSDPTVNQNHHGVYDGSCTNVVV